MKLSIFGVVAFFVMAQFGSASASESTNAPVSTNTVRAPSLKLLSTNATPLVWFDLLENDTNKCVIRLVDGRRFDVFIPDAPKTFYADQKDFSQQEALVALDKLRLERWKVWLDHFRRKPPAELARYQAQLAEHQSYISRLNGEKQKSAIPYHHVGRFQGYRAGRTNDLPKWIIFR
jgi:hypothetical protein